MSKLRKVRVCDIEFSEKNLVLIAGPCVIESRKVVFETCDFLKSLTKKLNLPFIFKASFDKANRTSINSFRGPGLKEGLKILKEVKKNFKVPVTSDIHCSTQAEPASLVLDLIQIPAFLFRQTDLLLSAAKTQKPINVKKAQFASPYDCKFCAEKIFSVNNKNVIFTERGTFFGYNNLVVDFRSLKIIQDLGFCTVFDGTHSVQLPSSQKGVSGGQREFVPGLVRAAVAFGCQGIFLEVHPSPQKALSDKYTMLDFKETETLLKEVKKIWEQVK